MPDSKTFMNMEPTEYPISPETIPIETSDVTSNPSDAFFMATASVTPMVKSVIQILPIQTIYSDTTCMIIVRSKC